MLKKNIYIIVLFLFLTSCGGNTIDSVKRGLTGAKSKGGDEFLVQKKDPLILPPDFENLPSPDERDVAEEEISVLEQRLETAVENNTSDVSSSTEDSILKKIQSK